jgi:hypothetical protein
MGIFDRWLTFDNEECPKDLKPLDRGMADVDEVAQAFFHQHPWHPYDPKMSRWHPCIQENRQLAKCFNSQDKDTPNKVAHVYCHLDRKALMVCLTKHKRQQREEAEAKKQAEQGISSS